MKLSKLIKLLQERQKALKLDPDVVIDYDENGWFELEEVKVVDCDVELMINIRSSNEA